MILAALFFAPACSTKSPAPWPLWMVGDSYAYLAMFAYQPDAEKLAVQSTASVEQIEALIPKRPRQEVAGRIVIMCGMADRARGRATEDILLALDRLQATLKSKYPKAAIIRISLAAMIAEAKDNPASDADTLHMSRTGYQNIRRKYISRNRV
jgi:hypothetical protein